MTKKIAGCVFVRSNPPISKFFTSLRKITISCDKNIKYNLKKERVELGEITCVTSEGVTLLSNMAVGEYLLCFSEKCNKEDVKQYFINCLSRENFSITRQEFEGKTLLITSAPFSVLAEKVNTLVLTEPRVRFACSEAFGWYLVV